MKTCAILELFSVHDHVIPSHIRYLTELGYAVTVFSPTPDFGEVSALLPGLDYTVVALDGGRYQGRGLAHIRERFVNNYKSLAALEGFDLVLLNTFRTELSVTDAIARRNKAVLAVLHTPKHGLKQKRYARFAQAGHRAFVLGRAMGEAFDLPWVAPLTYAQDRFLEPAAPESARRTFCVPGTVRFTGRTYMALVRCAQALQAQKREDVCFQILGRRDRKDGAAFMAAIRTAGVVRYFDFVSDVSHEAFLRHVIEADFVLPLIDRDEDKRGARHYIDMITSSVFLAIGLKTVVVCEEALGEAYGISDGAVLHPGGRLEQGVLAALDTSEAELAARRARLAALRDDMFGVSLEAMQRLVEPH